MSEVIWDVVLWAAWFLAGFMNARRRYTKRPRRRKGGREYTVDPSSPRPEAPPSPPPIPQVHHVKLVIEEREA